MIYWQLLATYFKIGLFCFGGGYAMLPLIQHEIVVKYEWLTDSEFAEIIAISQMTPGPIGINSATFIGYLVTGDAFGSIIATFAVCLPSFFIILLIANLYQCCQKLRSNTYISFRGLRFAVIVLIAFAAMLLMNEENFIDYKSFIIFGIACLLIWFIKIHPILLILLAGGVGLFL